MCTFAADSEIIFSMNFLTLLEICYSFPKRYSAFSLFCLSTLS